MTVKSPAELTAAAVNSPLIAEATVSPENTNIMTSKTTIPRGVLTIPMMEFPAFLDIVNHHPKD
jgi:hypothetical protein